jgi:hypothetical protein
VKEDGLALRFVKEQSPEICIAAIKQNPSAQFYVYLSIFEDDTIK